MNCGLFHMKEIEEQVYSIPLRRRLHSEHAISSRGHRRMQISNMSVDSTADLNEVPLGVGLGTHYAELYLGIPPQKASVIIDTGSHLTALPCNFCKDCGNHTDPLYDISKSKTVKYLPCHATTPLLGICQTCSNGLCHMGQAYKEGSRWEAIVINELTWIGQLSSTNENDKVNHKLMKKYAIPFPIGCQTNETGLFITQKENGIMGMGNHPATFLSFLHRQKKIKKKVFSICFSKNGGHMTIGAYDPRLHVEKESGKDGVQYTKLIQKKKTPQWYTVALKDLQLNGKTLGVEAKKYNTGKGLIVDSGSTDTFFTSEARDAFLTLFKHLTNGIEYSNKPMSLTPEDIEKLPNITLVFASDGKSEQGQDILKQDVKLEIPPTKYLTVTKSGKVYGNYHFTESNGGVLGASTMVGLDVIFDQDQHRIGFAYANCDKDLKSGDRIADIEKISGSDSKFTSSSLFFGLIMGSAFLFVILCGVFTVRRFNRITKGTKSTQTTGSGSGTGNNSREQKIVKKKLESNPKTSENEAKEEVAIEKEDTIEIVSQNPFATLIAEKQKERSETIEQEKEQKQKAVTTRKTLAVPSLTIENVRTPRFTIEDDEDDEEDIDDEEEMDRGGKNHAIIV